MRMITGMIKVSDILEDIGLVYKEVGGDYRVSCWFHEEKDPSMYINKELGYFHCFSCHTAGNIFSLISHHLNLEGVEILKYLNSYTKGKTTEELYTKLQETVHRAKTKKSVTRKLIECPQHNLLVAHAYLEKRGFTTEEIQEWKMGEVTETIYKGWIVIPIYQGGNLRTYFLRSPYNSRKLYGKFPRKDILVGLDSAQDVSQPIYVVEGIFDMIYLRRARVQAVAALSNRLYKEQLEILKGYKHIVIIPDNDEPGRQLVKDALPLLYSSKVSVGSVPDSKKDIAECSLEEIISVIYREQDIIKFIVRYKKWNLEQLTPQILNKSVTIKREKSYG